MARVGAHARGVVVAPLVAVDVDVDRCVRLASRVRAADATREAEGDGAAVADE